MCSKPSVCLCLKQRRTHRQRTAALNPVSAQGWWAATGELGEKLGSLQGGLVCVRVRVCTRRSMYVCVCDRPPSPRSERNLCLPFTSVQRSPGAGAGSCCRPLPVCPSHLAECRCACMPRSWSFHGPFLVCPLREALGLPGMEGLPGSSRPPCLSWCRGHATASSPQRCFVLNTADPPGACARRHRTEST